MLQLLFNAAKLRGRRSGDSGRSCCAHLECLARAPSCISCLAGYDLLDTMPDWTSYRLRSALVMPGTPHAACQAFPWTFVVRFLKLRNCLGMPCQVALAWAFNIERELSERKGGPTAAYMKSGAGCQQCPSSLARQVQLFAACAPTYLGQHSAAKLTQVVRS